MSLVYGKEELEAIKHKLNRIKEQLEYELPEFWWLSQGNIAIITVRVIEKDKRGLKIHETPKMTLRAAIRTIIKNIDLVKTLKGKEMALAGNIVEEDLTNIARVYALIKEAHDLVTKAEDLKRMLKQKNIDEATKADIASDIDYVIRWIRDIFTSNPYQFESKKNTISALLAKIEEKINSL